MFTSCPVTASDSEIRQFQRNIKLARLARRGAFRMRALIWCALPVLVATINVSRGLRKYGAGVKQQYGAGFAEQASGIFLGHLSRRITDETYYLYQLYLPERQGTLGRHFSFKQITPLQRYFTICVPCPDYPSLRSKHLFARHCVEAQLPTLPLVAEFSGGVHISENAESLPECDLFSKPSELYCGYGANQWKYQGSSSWKNATSGELFDRTSLVRRLAVDSNSGHIVVQRRVQNHASMIGSISTGALATLRIVTCRTPSGEIDFLPPVIRIPYGNAFVDNVAQGGLAAPVDLMTGVVSGPAIRRDERVGIATVEKHPDTGERFEGFRLPDWSDVLALALKAHHAVPSMHFVGWDVALLPGGPMLLEGNPWWDSDVTLLPHRIALADTQFIPYCNYHFGRTSAAR